MYIHLRIIGNLANLDCCLWNKMLLLSEDKSCSFTLKLNIKHQ
jgi:hypothetical protein